MSIEFNVLSSNYNTTPLRNTNNQPIKNAEIKSTSNNNNTSESPIAEGIRLYKNYLLTGVKELTSEEKEEIKSFINNYMEENNFLEKYSKNKATVDDYAGLNNFIQGLYKHFGSRGDYYEFVSEFVDGTLEEAIDPNNPPYPLFEVEIPPEHALENKQKRPMLMPFQSPSPHQFLMSGDSADKE